MRFKKLVVENYKCFQFPTEINFAAENTASGRNIFLIGAMNGAGKTSVLEAINIALYGERKDAILRAINRRERTKGNTKVRIELHLETDQGEQVTVGRSWSGAVGVVDPNPDDFDEKLIVTKNGQRVSVASESMWQDWLDVTIPKGISQFFIFDGEKIQDMAADEHSEVRLRSSMEAVLGIEFVRRLIDDINHIRNEERRGRSTVSDEDIQLKETELDALRRKHARLEEDRADCEKELQRFNEELKSKRTEFARLFGFDAEQSETRREKERQKIDVNTRLSQIDSEIRQVTENTLPLAMLGQHFAKLLGQVEAESRLKQQEVVRDMAGELTETIISKLFEPVTVCCHRSLKESERMTLRSRLLEIIQEVQSGQENIPSVKVILGLSDADRAKVQIRIEELESQYSAQLSGLLEERDELNERAVQLDREIRQRSVNKDEADLFEQLQSEIENCNQQIGRKREEREELDDRIDDVRQQIASEEQGLNLLYGKHHGGKEQREFLNKCTCLIDLLQEYVAHLRTTRIKELQQRTFEMYKKLASKGDLIANIEIDPQTYEIRIRDRHGSVVEKPSLSAGEKEVFAISLLWGLAKTTHYDLPIIIDTPLSRLDSMHRDAIVRNYFPDAGHQVIVLSIDTEVDKEYFRQLEPHLQSAIRLVFDKNSECTAIRPGYFWKEE